VTAEHAAFGHSLRNARLQRELTLESIADSTKIGAALLADLERGDLTRWPKGLFRRAFLREYAAAIGLPPEQVVSDVRRLFPEDGVAPPPAETATNEGLRLLLAADQPWWLMPTARRAVAASLDLLVVLLAGIAVAYLVSGSVSMVTVLIGFTYYGSATLFSGATPASLLLNQRWTFRHRAGSRPHTASVERPRLVFSGPGPSPSVDADDQEDALASTHENLRPSHAARG
jgi:transcriptional regulator with XRE-family HTH domain